MAGVRPVHPGERLDEGRLARAVLAGEGVHLSGEQLQGHVPQGAYRAEGLGDALERHYRGRPRVGRVGHEGLLDDAARAARRRVPTRRTSTTRQPDKELGCGGTASFTRARDLRRNRTVALTPLAPRRQPVLPGEPAPVQDWTNDTPSRMMTLP
ncbi:hypothetical protein SSP24_38090 [Streptomyces spinoverrucosus]|uniref:Uncharacterized protein n=1 Tax=Streptomyces spinoverrucosus TaxID=284043 RepID=A0A4Y3VGU6_9ACTN|nr:hypothetical protein SSP24_38090 [Streptomyces spinoverrucosus]